MLFTKCILSERNKADGLRISVMSRHTLSDGRTPDPRIRSFDLHVPMLGPSSSLVGDYYKRRILWPEFESRYLEEVAQESKKKLVRWLGRIALDRDVTLLCIEEDSDYCHRRLLAEACKVHSPKLVVHHR